jgi:predicted  nucleic acid-binding Zn-ribbon protein
MEEAKKVVQNLTDDDRDQMERDVFDLVGAKMEQDEPVVLEFESINVLKPGTYNLDLVQMFKNDPLVFKVGEGKYFLDINETFRKVKEGKLK